MHCWIYWLYSVFYRAHSRLTVTFFSSFGMRFQKTQRFFRSIRILRVYCIRETSLDFIPRCPVPFIEAGSTRNYLLTVKLLDLPLESLFSVMSSNIARLFLFV